MKLNIITYLPLEEFWCINWKYQDYNEKPSKPLDRDNPYDRFHLQNKLEFMKKKYPPKKIVSKNRLK